MTEAEEIVRLKWFLHEITNAWYCGEEDEVAALIELVDAHQWDDENGYLPEDQSMRRAYAMYYWDWHFENRKRGKA